MVGNQQYCNHVRRILYPVFIWKVTVQEIEFHGGTVSVCSAIYYFTCNLFIPKKIHKIYWFLWVSRFFTLLESMCLDGKDNVMAVGWVTIVLHQKSVKEPQYGNDLYENDCCVKVHKSMTVVIEGEDEKSLIIWVHSSKVKLCHFWIKLWWTPLCCLALCKREWKQRKKERGGRPQHPSDEVSDESSETPFPKVCDDFCSFPTFGQQCPLYIVIGQVWK